jgi:hypothetical protein
LVVTRFIETTELLRVQEPKNNILAEGDYFRADGPYEIKTDRFDPFLNTKEYKEYSYT